MYVCYVLFIVLIYLGVCQSSYREPIVDELRCLEACQLKHNRECRRPPLMCGECLPSYTADINGNCRERPASTVHTRQTFDEVIQQDKLAASMELKSPANLLHRKETNLDVIRKDALPAESSGQSARQIPMPPAPTLDADTQPVYTKHDMTYEIIFISVLLVCCVIALIGIIILVVCWCRVRTVTKAASEVDYPAYGATGPSYHYQGAPRPQSNDRKLAQSAQMFHYQHQKQQMLEIEKSTNGALKAASEPSSGEESDGEQFTVYECPGLATTGEMEVRNPLYMEAGDSVAPSSSKGPLHSSSSGGGDAK